MFQQKWKAKQLVRGYHGDWLPEHKFKKKYLPDGLPPIVGNKAAGEERVPLASLMFAEVEKRLDTVVFRCCFADSVYKARAMVIHGKVTLNGQVVSHDGRFGPLFPSSVSLTLPFSSALADPRPERQAAAWRPHLCRPVRRRDPPAPSRRGGPRRLRGTLLRRRCSQRRRLLLLRLCRITFFPPRPSRRRRPADGPAAAAVPPARLRLALPLRPAVPRAELLDVLGRVPAASDCAAGRERGSESVRGGWRGDAAGVGSSFLSRSSRSACRGLPTDSSWPGVHAQEYYTAMGRKGDKRPAGMRGKRLGA